MFKLFRKKFPHCDALFKKYVGPWLPNERYREMTRPDMYIIAGYEGHPLNLETLQFLPEQELLKEKNQITKMVKAALGDYQHIISSNEIRKLISKYRSFATFVYSNRRSSISPKRGFEWR